MGLIEAQKQPLDLTRFGNFEELIHGVFGAGIAKYFMMPYNFKVWAHPPKMMNKEWIGERVSVVDIERVLGNVVLDRDDAGWGPNSTFKYPRHGGTGGLFERMRPYVEENLRLERRRRVGSTAKRRKSCSQDGTRERYDILLNTMPMDLLVKSIDGDVPGRGARARRRGCATRDRYIVGVGVKQPVAVEEVLDVFPGGRTAPFYRRHLSVELFARSRARSRRRTTRCSPRSRTPSSSR